VIVVLSYQYDFMTMDKDPCKTYRLYRNWQDFTIDI